MIKRALAALLTSLIAASAFAVDAETVSKQLELKDGSTVYIFEDGRMGMEDRFGRPFMMKEGHVMETKDGQKVMMMGSEVWRIERMHDLYRGSN